MNDEQRLIDVNTFNGILTPEDSLTTMQGDNRVLQRSREAHAIDIRKRLTTLDLSTVQFEKRSTVPIEVRLGDVAQIVDWPIRSISAERMREISSRVNEISASIPKRPEGGQMVNDESHPKYVPMTMALIAAATEMQKQKLLYGLDMELTQGKKVLWSPHNPAFQDLDGAIQALDEIGIKASDIRTITMAIDKLSGESTLEEDEELEKK